MHILQRWRNSTVLVAVYCDEIHELSIYVCLGVKISNLIEYELLEVISDAVLLDFLPAATGPTGGYLSTLFGPDGALTGDMDAATGEAEIVDRIPV